VGGGILESFGIRVVDQWESSWEMREKPEVAWVLRISGEGQGAVMSVRVGRVEKVRGTGYVGEVIIQKCTG